MARSTVARSSSSVSCTAPRFGVNPSFAASSPYLRSSARAVGVLHALGVIGERLGDDPDGLHLEARGFVLVARGVQEFDGFAHLRVEMRCIDADKCRDGTDLGLALARKTSEARQRARRRTFRMGRLYHARRQIDELHLPGRLRQIQARERDRQLEAREGRHCPDSRYRTPSRSVRDGLWEWPLTTTWKPEAAGSRSSCCRSCRT